MADQWYYARNNQRLGPVTTPQLQQLAAAGQLSPGDLLWKDGMPSWAPAGSIPGLFAAPAAAPSPVMAPPGVAAAPPQYGDVAAFGAPPARSRGGAGELVQNTIARVLMGNIDTAPVSEAEQVQLAANGVAGETAQRFLTWRRSVLWVAVFPLGVMAILNTIYSILNVMGVYSVLGIMIEVVQILCWLALPGLVAWAALTWSKLRTCNLILMLAFLVGFAVPLLINVLPNRWWVEDIKKVMESQAKATKPDDAAKAMEDAQWFMMRYGLGTIGAFAFLNLLPILMAFGAGAVRACARMKFLIPESGLPGIVLLAAGPLAAAIILAAGFLLYNAVDNILVFLTTILLMISPAIYLAVARTMIRPVTTPAERSAANLWQWISFGIAAAGALCLAIFVIINLASSEEKDPKKALEKMMAKGEGAITKHYEGLTFMAIRFYFDLAGRSLFMMAFASQFLIWAAVSAWRTGQPVAQAVDKRMSELEPIVGKI